MASAFELFLILNPIYFVVERDEIDYQSVELLEQIAKNIKFEDFFAFCKNKKCFENFRFLSDC